MTLQTAIVIALAVPVVVFVAFAVARRSKEDVGR